MAKVGRFVSEAAKIRHDRAYAAAMDLWPAHETRIVDTGYGPTGVQVVTTSARRDRLPVVLLHGLSATAAQWWPNVDAWAADRDVYAIDAICDPGTSRQTKPVAGGGAMADWLDQTLDRLTLDRVHLAGFSYGGWVAINHAIRSPGRIATLTAMDPAASFSSVRLRFYATMIRSLLAKRRQDRFGWILDESSPPELWDLFDASRGFRPAGMPVPKRFTDSELARITMPTLTLLGARSAVAKPATVHRRLARILPHAQIVILDTRHGVPMDDPVATNKLTNEFWAAHDEADTTDPQE